MPPAVSIINEVESALHNASDARQVDVLRRVTNGFGLMVLCKTMA